jgi:hypothetical protein
LSRNQNITYNNVICNQDKPWNWSNLSSNPSMLLCHNELCNIIKEYHSISVIQRIWKHVISNPEYMMCKRRLLHEYNTMDT